MPFRHYTTKNTSLPILINSDRYICTFRSAIENLINAGFSIFRILYYEY